VASEKKRREAIREGFYRITNIVPDLDSSQSRSEATVLAKSMTPPPPGNILFDFSGSLLTTAVDFLRKLVEENKVLTQLAKEHNIPLPEDED
jgi:hypothetical protein